MISFYLNFSWVFDHKIISKRKHNKDSRSRVQLWKRKVLCYCLEYNYRKCFSVNQNRWGLGTQKILYMWRDWLNHCPLKIPIFDYFIMVTLVNAHKNGWHKSTVKVLDLNIHPQMESRDESENWRLPTSQFLVLFCFLMSLISTIWWKWRLVWILQEQHRM